MGNGHEPAGHKGVDDGQKENQGGDQIEFKIAQMLPASVSL
jgi:hypothetical protein